MKTPDRRRYPRYEAGSLSGTLDDLHAFEALKIGLGGLLISIGQELPLNGRVRVAVELDGETLSCQARVVFVGPDLTRHDQDGHYRVGLAFIDPDPAHQLMLARYLQRWE